MKILRVTILGLLVVANTCLGETSQYQDLFVCARRFLRVTDGLWRVIPIPEDGMARTAMERDAARASLEHPGIRIRITDVCEGPTPIDGRVVKYALATADTDRGVMIYLISKGDKSWSIRRFSREWLRKKAAEPGATDNPGDAQ